MTLKLAAFLTLVVLVWGGSYVFRCWWWPFGPCPRCEGAGKHLSPSGRYWRDCRRCKGRGRRLRLGRRVWNRLHRIEKAGTR